MPNYAKLQPFLLELRTYIAVLVTGEEDPDREEVECKEERLVLLTTSTTLHHEKDTVEENTFW